MNEPFIGEIQMFSGDYVPKGWMPCHGQTLKIRDYTPLYSVLGKAFGGDGITTFALPDLRGRAAMQAGQGRGLTKREFGKPGGQSHVRLKLSEMPVHKHVAHVNSKLPAASASPLPAGGVWARSQKGYTAAEPTTSLQLHPEAIGEAGEGKEHNNMQPYLPMGFIIAVEGLYPMRS